MPKIFCHIKGSKRKKGEEKGKREKEDTDGPSALKKSLPSKRKKNQDNDLQSKEKKSKKAEDKKRSKKKEKVSASNVQLPPSQLVRPQGGVETPKSLFSPINCISVPYKEEKREMNRQIESLKQEIDDLKSSLSKGPQSSSTVLTPSGEMDANEAAKKGLVPIAQGVYCCNVKVQALIHSVSSHTALACKMLDIFYPKDVLTGKRLKELDTRVVDAIADFALVAANEKDKNETEDDGKSKERKKNNPWECHAGHASKM